MLRVVAVCVGIQIKGASSVEGAAECKTEVNSPSKVDGIDPNNKQRLDSIVPFHRVEYDTPTVVVTSLSLIDMLWMFQKHKGVEVAQAGRWHGRWTSQTIQRLAGFDYSSPAAGIFICHSKEQENNMDKKRQAWYIWCLMYERGYSGGAMPRFPLKHKEKTL